MVLKKFHQVAESLEDHNIGENMGDLTKKEIEAKKLVAQAEMQIQSTIVICILRAYQSIP